MFNRYQNLLDKKTVLDLFLSETLIVRLLQTQSKALYKAYSHLETDRETALEAVRRKSGVSRDSSDRLKNDEKFLFEAVEQEGCAVMYASNEVRKNREQIDVARNTKIRDDVQISKKDSKSLVEVN